MDKKSKIISGVLLLIIAGCILWFATHDFSKNTLNDEVIATNRLCQLDCGAAGVLSKVQYDKGENIVKLIWQLNDNYFNYATLADNAEVQEQCAVLAFQQQNVRKLLKETVKAKASMLMEYATDGKDIQVSIPAEKLAEYDAQPLLSITEAATVAVHAQAEAENSLCPEEMVQKVLGKQVTLEKVAVEGDYYVYDFKFPTDADLKWFKSLTNAGALVKADIKEQQKRQGSMRSLIKMLEVMKYGMIYRYTAPDAAAPEAVEVTPQEIHNISML